VQNKDQGQCQSGEGEMLSNLPPGFSRDKLNLLGNTGESEKKGGYKRNVIQTYEPCITKKFLAAGGANPGLGTGKKASKRGTTRPRGGKKPFPQKGRWEERINKNNPRCGRRPAKHGRHSKERIWAGKNNEMTLKKNGITPEHYSEIVKMEG